MVDCREATELAQRGLDTPLDRWSRAKLGIHRLLCAPCRIYKRQLAQLRRLGAQLRDTAPADAALDGAARERIRARLRESGKA